MTRKFVAKERKCVVCKQSFTTTPEKPRVKRCPECVQKNVRYKWGKSYEQQQAIRKAWIAEKNLICLQRLRQGCSQCDEKDLVCLEFDHIDPLSKVACISLMRKNYTPEKLKIELNKCVVLCANCHKRRTAAQYGSWKLKIEP